MSIFHTMSKQRDTVSKGYKKIIDWILNNPSLAASMTSQEIAFHAEVSQSSIIKFIQKLGFNKFSEFKLSIAEDLVKKENNTSLHNDIFIDDSLFVTAHKLLQTKINAISDTTNALSQKKIDDAVTLIDNAERIQIVGIGGSHLTARDFSYKLLKLGITTLIESDNHFQLAESRILTPKDLQICISFSGNRKEVLIAAETARQQGVKIISLTSSRKSKLRKMSNIVIDTIADENVNRISSIASRSAQHVVIDIIFMRLVQLRRDNAKILIDEINNDIKKLLF